MMESMRIILIFGVALLSNFIFVHDAKAVASPVMKWTCQEGRLIPPNTCLVQSIEFRYPSAMNLYSINWQHKAVIKRGERQRTFTENSATTHRSTQDCWPETLEQILDAAVRDGRQNCER